MWTFLSMASKLHNALIKCIKYTFLETRRDCLILVEKRTWRSSATHAVKVLCALYLLILLSVDWIKL